MAPCLAQIRARRLRQPPLRRAQSRTLNARSGVHRSIGLLHPRNSRDRFSSGTKRAPEPSGGHCLHPQGCLGTFGTPLPPHPRVPRNFRDAIASTLKGASELSGSEFDSHQLHDATSCLRTQGCLGTFGARFRPEPSRLHAAASAASAFKRPISRTRRRPGAPVHELAIASGPQASRSGWDTLDTRSEGVATARSSGACPFIGS